jgi:hypothetical protein
MRHVHAAKATKTGDSVLRSIRSLTQAYRSSPPVPGQDSPTSYVLNQMVAVRSRRCFITVQRALVIATLRLVSSDMTDRKLLNASWVPGVSIFIYLSRLPQDLSVMTEFHLFQLNQQTQKRLPTVMSQHGSIYAAGSPTANTPANVLFTGYPGSIPSFSFSVVTPSSFELDNRQGT